MTETVAKRGEQSPLQRDPRAAAIGRNYSRVWFVWPLGMVLATASAPMLAAQAHLPVWLLYIMSGSLLGLAVGTAARARNTRSFPRLAWVHALWPIVALGIVVAIFGVPGL
jgi:hypothetical protein